MFGKQSNKNNNNWDSEEHGQMSERDRLDIDNSGKSYKQRQDEKMQQQQQQYGNNMNGNYGKPSLRDRFSRNGNNHRNSGQGNDRWGPIGAIVVLALVGFLIYSVVAYKSGTLANPLRSIFASPEENVGSFMQGVIKVDKTISELDGQQVPGTPQEDDVYSKNNIYTDLYLPKQVDPEYMVFIYTGNEELDNPFIKWVEKYESAKYSEKDSEDKEVTVPKERKFMVYRLKYELLKNNVEIQEYKEASDTPMVVIYRTLMKGEKRMDSVIKDPKHLNSLHSYMTEMQKEDNANWDN